jgi:hypothetical protein
MPRNPEQLHQHSTSTANPHSMQTARGPGVSGFGQTQSSGVPSQTGQGRQLQGSSRRNSFAHHGHHQSQTRRTIISQL